MRKLRKNALKVLYLSSYFFSVLTYHLLAQPAEGEVIHQTVWIDVLLKSFFFLILYPVRFQEFYYPTCIFQGFADNSRPLGGSFRLAI